MYPILLVRGLGDKDFVFIHSFRHLQKVLRAKGFNVYISKQDALGSIEENGIKLRDEILEIIKKENVPKIHIIAHSKGGLDARYCIDKCGMDKYVLSLTTLSTPHRGSVMASNLLKMPHFLAVMLNLYWNIFFRLIGDEKPNLIVAAKELTPEYLEKFNQNVLNREGVYYQSYAAVPLKKQKSYLSFPHFLMKKFGKKDNDGLVDLESAKWGDFKGTIPAYHHYFVRKRPTKKKDDIINNLYANILKDLEKLENK